MLINPVISEFRLITLTGRIISNARFLLIVLTVTTLFWAICYLPKVEIGPRTSVLRFFVVLIAMTLLIFFRVDRLLKIYISFEVSVIPIFIIVIGWGYQRERLNASLRLLFYTLTASMPLLIILIWARKRVSHLKFHSLLLLRLENTRGLGIVFSITIFLAFGVKLPIFGLHIWLPKAHVEAPVIGSIVLAAILLKLGRYGLWLFLPLYFSQIFLGSWISISLIGALSVSLLCLRLRDLKIIIAYSSVRHIGLIVISLFITRKLSVAGAVFLIIAHGMSSSAIFIIAFILYQTNHSRRLLLTKGIISWCRITPLFWFLILIANIASPPTFSLLAEILVITSIVVIRKINIIFIILIIIARTAYSLIMYSSRIQGVSIVTSSQKVIFINELLILLNHLVWVFLTVLGLGIFTLH